MPWNRGVLQFWCQDSQGCRNPSVASREAQAATLVWNIHIRATFFSDIFACNEHLPDFLPVDVPVLWFLPCYRFLQLPNSVLSQLKNRPVRYNCGGSCWFEFTWSWMVTKGLLDLACTISKSILTSCLLWKMFLVTNWCALFTSRIVAMYLYEYPMVIWW